MALTPEDQKQVQSLINSRTKLLNEKITQQEEKITQQEEKIAQQNEKIAQQEEKIFSLSTQLDEKQQEISMLKSKLEEAIQLNSSLQAKLSSINTAHTQTQPQQISTQKPQKPSYLVSLLRQHFNLDSFKTGQEEIIDAILSNRDIFCSMPNHYGMSICYSLPALLMPGLTLVITRNKLSESKLNQYTEILTQSITAPKKREILRKIKNGAAKILFTQLESLKNEEIINTLKNIEISFAVIYEKSSNIKSCMEFIDSLSSKRINRGVFMNSTSPSERQEILKLLRSPLKVITGFNKNNLSFNFIHSENKQSVLKDLLAQKINKKIIIYCSTPETAYKLRELLRDYKGLNENITIMPSILYYDIKHEKVDSIIHYDISRNLAAYSQEINFDASECIILFSQQDMKTADKSIINFIEDDSPNKFLLSYLGQNEYLFDEENIVINDNDNDKFMPEDYSDFDFGSSNEAQKEAVTSTSGPLLIIAAPGTGKTYTLIQRAIFLIQKKHVKPENILLASFTNKSAQELKTRIALELSHRNINTDISRMYIGTFHVICEKILKEYADYTPHGKTFRIIDDFGHAYLIMQNMRLFENINGFDEIFRTQGKWKRSQELRDYINNFSEELIDPEELIRDEDIAVSALGRAIKIHDDLLAENNYVSYSALLVSTYKLLRDNPEILEALQKKIKYIMIDEYQDTNYVQEQLIFLLGSENKNICVVGDDDQSLYRFRGAEVRNILEFPEKFGKNECKIVKLMLNYRSTPEIIKFASDWINNTNNFFEWQNFRYEKNMEAFRENQNYPSVIRLAGINDKEGWHEKIFNFLKNLKESGAINNYNQIAFLFRSVKVQSVQELSQFLESHNINVYSPRSNLFFNRPEIHFAIGCLISIFPSYLNSLESGDFLFNGQEPEYISYYKMCLKILSRYIDRPMYIRLRKWLLDKRNYHGKFSGYANYTFTDLLYELFQFMPFNHALSADIKGDVKDLRPARNLAKLIKIFKDYEHSYHIYTITSKYIVNQVQMMMNLFLRFRIEDGIDEYESEDIDIPENHVAFMTIHQAKGKEFPIVFVDSLFSKPESELRHDRNNVLISDIEHKHSHREIFEPSESIKYFDFWRMYYVAFTRAQNLLILTCNENNNTPSQYFESSYDKLDDADDVFDFDEVEPMPEKNSGINKIYSFTKDILIYESCPMQYKFFKVLDFMPDISQTTFMGNLVHATIEDIHRAVINNEINKINEINISDWFNQNYEKLSKSECVYLTQEAKENAFLQVMHYVNLQNNNWNGILFAESETALVREKYILEGKIDLIKNIDGETEIIDFKTGPKPNINITSERDILENYRRQIHVYGYLAVHTMGLNIARLKLYYTGEPSSSPEIVYQYDENEAEKVINNIDVTAENILKENFEERTDNHDTCSECIFKFYCGRAE